MKVKFANAEVDVWKLRKGTTLMLSGSGDIVHLKSIDANIGKNGLKVYGIMSSHYDGEDRELSSEYYIWLEPHD
jgi:hypothetical protein